MASLKLPTAIIALLLTCASATQAAKPRVELELFTVKGIPILTTQKWMGILKDLKFDRLQIRSGSAFEEPSVENVGSERSPIYHVKGMLDRRNQMIVPGAVFSLRDKRQIADWMEKIKAGASSDAPKGAFGLTGDELVALHRQMSVPIFVTTKDADPKEVVRQIAGKITIGIGVDPDSRAAFEDGYKLEDELQGISAGTTLAAVVRPLGLVVVPRKSRGTVSLLITDFRKAKESWPIGWPPKKRPNEVLPKLFTFLPIEIVERPLLTAVEALQQRLEVPIVWDRNAIARHKIDLERVKVSIPATKTYYKKAFDRVLFQAKLKSELRLDESDAPFLWVTSIK